MLWNILADEAAQAPAQNNTVFFIMLIAIVVLFVVYFLFSGRKNKQRQKEYVEQLAALQPGHKVKTAGGICGIVVEVCDDNTVIIETGSEQSGRSYIKMDKELIVQSDAKGPSQIAREEAEAARKHQKDSKNPNAKVELPAREEPKAEESKSGNEEK